MCGHRASGRISHMAHVEDIPAAFIAPQIGGTNLLSTHRSIEPDRLASPFPSVFPLATPKTQLLHARANLCTSPIPTWRCIIGRTCLCSRGLTPPPPQILFLSSIPLLIHHPRPDKPDIPISARPSFHPGLSPYHRPYIIHGTRTKLSTGFIMP